MRKHGAGDGARTRDHQIHNLGQEVNRFPIPITPLLPGSYEVPTVTETNFGVELSNELSNADHYADLRLSMTASFENRLTCPISMKLTASVFAQWKSVAFGIRSSDSASSLVK
jgi:hypothetical protein